MAARSLAVKICGLVGDVLLGECARGRAILGRGGGDEVFGLPQAANDLFLGESALPHIRHSPSG